MATARTTAPRRGGDTRYKASPARRRLTNFIALDAFIDIDDSNNVLIAVDDIGSSRLIDAAYPRARRQ